MRGDLDLRQDVLHVLRVRYRSTADDVATRLDVDSGELRAVLDRLASEGFVEYRDGRMPGWVLTRAGKAAHAEKLAAWRSSTSTSELEKAYEEFLALNGPFKRLCTDHQFGYRPEEVPLRLARIDSRVRAIVLMASGPCPRMSTYSGAFARAYERIVNGDLHALTEPLSGSYHDVWMELHQDLLVTLGRSRGEHDER